MFQCRRDSTLRSIRAHLEIAAVDIPSTPDSISSIAQLASKITRQLGEYGELFLAFEAALSESVQLFSAHAAIERGRADKAQGVPYREGYQAFLTETLANESASKRVADTQDLYNQVANRLSERELLSEFVRMYRELVSMDKYTKMLYKTGYKMNEQSRKG